MLSKRANAVTWLFIAACMMHTKSHAQVCEPGWYQAGAAQADITGPIVGVGMMGYADLAQIDQGLHMRLRARALVVEDPCQNTTTAIVINDLSMIFGGLKAAVIEQLQLQLPGVFTHDNVLLSATHSHAGPGGYANYVLYNITTLGFSPKNFAAIVDGTVTAIVKAYAQRQKSQLAYSQGDLEGWQFNRSPEAYDNNPAAERARYRGNTDTLMSVLKVREGSGRALAAFSWYPVHGVSLPMQNKLVSGDNKGMASYLFEKHMGASYLREGEFVAGFLQSNAGDISPYALNEHEQKDLHGFARNHASGRAQFEKAQQLLASPDEVRLTGPVAYSHRFEALAYRSLRNGKVTCNAVLGVAFAAGTENGQPVGLFKEGKIYGVNWPRITVMPHEQDCHAEKVLLLPTGFAKPSSWTAEHAAFQIVRLGELAIIATPFEITTMAGRRLREAVLQEMAPLGVRFVALTALANEYLHYVTTREEYAKQAYEGGSTLFGPASLEAYTEIFLDVAKELAHTSRTHSTKLPPIKRADAIVHEPRPAFDTVTPLKDFGDVELAPLASYQLGQSVDVTFLGGHPVHGPGQGSSFFTVEALNNDSFVPVLYDWDADTELRWEKYGVNGSRLKITWHTTKDTLPGLYRICHSGKHKPWFRKDLKTYRGCTDAFAVEAKS